MPVIVTTLLALLAAAPGAFAQISALWATVRGGFSASDQTTVDAILAALSPKLDADLAKLQADAGQGA